VRWPLRVGMAYSAPYAVSAVHWGIDTEFQAPHLSKSVAVFLATAVDAVDIPDAGTPAQPYERAFSSIYLGGGIFVHTPGIGPAVTLTLGGGILMRKEDVVGGGVSLVVNVYPYYYSVVDAVECARGPYAAYLASSLFFWTGGRLDVANESRGGTVSFGVGMDISRSVLLPVIAYAMKQGCSKPGGPTRRHDERDEE